MDVISKEGKNTDFDECYRRCTPNLYRVAFRLVQNHADALDVVQESFYRAYKNWSRFRGQARVSTWLYRIAVNLSYDLLRRRTKVKKMELFENYGFKSDVYDGEKAVARDGILAKVQEEIAGLTPKQKKVFILKTYEELPYLEIARITRSRVGTVKATYFQAVQKLRKKLKAKGVVGNDLS